MLKLSKTHRIAFALRAAMLMKEIAQIIQVDDVRTIEMIVASVDDHLNDLKKELNLLHHETPPS